MPGHPKTPVTKAAPRKWEQVQGDSRRSIFLAEGKTAGTRQVAGEDSTGKTVQFRLLEDCRPLWRRREEKGAGWRGGRGAYEPVCMYVCI